MVDHLCLPICLGVIGGTHFEGSTLTFEEGLPEVAHKNFVPIRDYRFWKTMEAYYLTHKNGSHKVSGEGDDGAQ